MEFVCSLDRPIRGSFELHHRIAQLKKGYIGQLVQVAERNFLGNECGTRLKSPLNARGFPRALLLHTGGGGNRSTRLLGILTQTAIVKACARSSVSIPASSRLARNKMGEVETEAACVDLVQRLKSSSASMSSCSAVAFPSVPSSNASFFFRHCAPNSFETYAAWQPGIPHSSAADASPAAPPLPPSRPSTPTFFSIDSMSPPLGFSSFSDVSVERTHASLTAAR